MKSTVLSRNIEVFFGCDIPEGLLDIKGLKNEELSEAMRVNSFLKSSKTVTLHSDNERGMEALSCIRPLPEGTYYCCNTNSEGIVTIVEDTEYKNYQFAFTRLNDEFLMIEKPKPTKLSKQLQSPGKADEYYTPVEAIVPILEYIPENAVVWCPFDTEESNFVKLISKTNRVIFSHIDNGQDFYEFEPDEHWDIMISNPPFSGKKKIFERAMSFGKPYALLMTAQWLNDAAPSKLWGDKTLELMFFDKRIHYLNGLTGETVKKTTFASVYYCENFLPRQILWKSVN